MLKPLIIAAPLVVALAFGVFAADTVIDQAEQHFSKSSATLRPGDTIHFVNHDEVTHNIMVVNPEGEIADQGLQKPGEIITAQFDHNGLFQIRCAIHPRMKVRVDVQ
jgi:plastocyanin